MRQTLVLILTLVALCSAQQRDVNYTGNFPNGRFWNTSSDAEKLHYLVAVRDATVLAEEKGTCGQMALRWEITRKSWTRCIGKERTAIFQ